MRHALYGNCSWAGRQSFQAKNCLFGSDCGGAPPEILSSSTAPPQPPTASPTAAPTRHCANDLQCYMASNSPDGIGPSAHNQVTTRPQEKEVRNLCCYRRQQCALIVACWDAARWSQHWRFRLKREALCRASAILLNIRLFGGGESSSPLNTAFWEKPYLDIGPIENRARPTSEPSTRAWKSSVDLDPSSLIRFHANNGNDGDLATEIRTAEQENPWWQVELSEPTVRAATFWILDFLCKHRVAITLFMRPRCEADGETPFQA